MRRVLVVLVLVVLALSAGAIGAAWAPDRPVESLLARWAHAPSRFVDVDGMRVHLRDEGPRDDPVPIVLIHGTSASLHTWEGWAAALRQERRVVSFDLPGFGLTGPSVDGDYSIAAYTRFVLILLDALKIDRCVLGGNSLGGEIAWHVAAAAPRRVDRLVLVDAGGYAFKSKSVPIGFRLARVPFLRDLASQLLPRILVERSVREVYGDPSRVSNALVDRYYELTLREGNRRALVQRFEQLQPGADAALIRGLRLPTLIIWGGRDRLIPPEAANDFAGDIAGSRRVVFDELGHVPHEEDPARSVAAVMGFLEMAPGR